MLCFKETDDNTKFTNKRKQHFHFFQSMYVKYLSAAVVSFDVRAWDQASLKNKISIINLSAGTITKAFMKGGGQVIKDTPKHKIYRDVNLKLSRKRGCNQGQN